MNEVGLAKFKAHLSQYLREARSGAAITVTDRGVAVARLVPAAWNGLREFPAVSGLRKLPLPPPSNSGIDIVAALLEERQKRR